MADPYTTPIPGAANYEQAAAAATTAYGNALTRLNQQRQDTLQQYGYSSSVDPKTGVVSNVAVDPNLPYGQYQQERQAHADQYEAARQSAQDRGLGHGGLAAQGVTRLRQGFGAEDAALGTGLSGQLGNFQDQQNQAAYQKDSALYTAQEQQLQDAIAQQQFDQAQYDAQPTDQTDWSSIIQQLLGGDGSGNDASNTPVPTDTPPPVTSLLAKGVTKKASTNISGLGGQLTGVKIGGKTTTLPKVAAKPAAKPAPKPAVQPQTKTQAAKPAPKPAPKPAAKPAPKKKK